MVGYIRFEVHLYNPVWIAENDLRSSNISIRRFSKQFSI